MGGREHRHGRHRGRGTTKPRCCTGSTRATVGDGERTLGSFGRHSRGGAGRPDPRDFMCDPPAPRGIGTWRVRGGEMLVQLWRWQGLALHLLKADSQLELGKCSFFCCIPSSCHCHPREPPGPAPWGGRGHIEDTEVPAVTEKRGRVPGGRTLPGPHGGSGDPGAGTGTRLPFRWPSAHRGDSGTRCGQ